MNKKRNVLFLAVVHLLAAGNLGCSQLPPPTPTQYDVGLIYMFPGVEGGPATLTNAAHGLRDAGVESAIELFDWQRPIGGLTNLTLLAENRTKALEVVDRVRDFRDEHPAAPIDLIGYSGGGGMAIFVAEALPPDVRVRNVILAHPALCPTYDLDPTLEHIDGKLVNFYSTGEWVILGLGTTLFGTMDRSVGASAGMTGFQVEKAAALPDMRRHVEQRAWSPEMISSGHWGDHIGILAREWNRRYVAPYLLQTEPAHIPPPEQLATTFAMRAAPSEPRR